MIIDDFKLPSNYFNSMEFTMQVGCSVGCNFCPQGTFVKNYKSNIKRFSKENFEKALSNLEGSSVKEIKFSGFSEPLENNEIYDFVRIAYNKGYKVELITTLKHFSKEQFEKIKDLSITCHISIQPPSLNNRKGLSDEEAWENIAQLLSASPKCNIVFGCLDNNLSTWHKNALKDLERKLNISIKYEKYTQRAGYLNKSDINLKHQQLICKHNMGPVALPNGDLALCCMDFGLKHIIGNIFEQKYTTILNNDKFIDIVSIMLCKKEGDILCHTCEYAKAIPKFITAREFSNLRNSIRNFRDGILPKNSYIRTKLNSLFK